MADSVTCLACGEPLRLKPVWCADCRTPHHRDCFARAGRCAAARCAGRRFSDARIGPGVNAIEVRAADGTAELKSFIVDFTSHRELASNVAIWLAAGATLAGSLAGVALLLVAILVRRQLSDYRVISGADRVIWLHSTFLGRSRLTREATFTEVGRVVVAWEQKGARRLWRVWLHMLDGHGLCMTDEAWQAAADPRQSAAPPPDLADVAHGIGDLLGVPVAVERDWTRSSSA